jgi:hypothetical protein
MTTASLPEKDPARTSCVRTAGSGEAEAGTWVRLFDPAGRLIPTFGEAESARANAERARADAAEAELKRLRSLLGGRAE